MNIQANAKINLSLEILPKRADNYHNIETVFQSIELHDELTIESADQISLEVIQSDEKIPTDEKNLVWIAAKLLCDEFKLSGVRIKLTKNIPSSAGLAGGSSDAAATIRAMNQIFNLNLSTDELQNRAAKIGSDVAFCISGGIQFATGRGEILQPLKKLPSTPILLIKPSIEISTAWAYKIFDEQKIDDRYNSKQILESIKSADWNIISKNLFNRFENIISQKYPEIIELKNKLIELGAMNSIMSGSGSTVFGIFNDINQAESAFDKLKNLNAEIFLTRTI